MRNNNINYIINAINMYDGYTYKDSIEDRLSKTLDLYMKELNLTCNNIMNKRRKDLVMKELNK